MPDASSRAEVLLTSEALSREFPLGAVPEAPAAAEVALLRITNPSGEAFAIQVSLVPADGEGTGRIVELGSFTPYPADRTGSYLVTVPNPAKEVLKSGDPGTRVRVSLEPVAPDRPLPTPLEVVLTEPVWRGAR
jgi:hypothetical protein